MKSRAPHARQWRSKVSSDEAAPKRRPTVAGTSSLHWIAFRSKPTRLHRRPCPEDFCVPGTLYQFQLVPAIFSAPNPDRCVCAFNQPAEDITTANATNLGQLSVGLAAAQNRSSSANVRFGPRLSNRRVHWGSAHGSVDYVTTALRPSWRWLIICKRFAGVVWVGGLLLLLWSVTAGQDRRQEGLSRAKLFCRSDVFIVAISAPERCGPE